MIALPSWVVATQWVVLFALGVLVFVMYRQLAYLLHLGSAAAASGLELGDRAPAFRYRGVANHGDRGLAFGDLPTVLLFTDPRCGACEDALAAIEHATAAGRTTGVRVLAVTDADPVAVAASDSLRATGLEVALVDSSVVHGDYRVTATPSLLGIDEHGVVCAKITGVNAATAKRFLKDFRRALNGEARPAATRTGLVEEEEYDG